MFRHVVVAVSIAAFTSAAFAQSRVTQYEVVTKYVVMSTNYGVPVKVSPAYDSRYEAELRKAEYERDHGPGGLLASSRSQGKTAWIEPVQYQVSKPFVPRPDSRRDQRSDMGKSQQLPGDRKTIGFDDNAPEQSPEGKTGQNTSSGGANPDEKPTGSSGGGASTIKVEVIGPDGYTPPVVTVRALTPGNDGSVISPRKNPGPSRPDAPEAASQPGDYELLAGRYSGGFSLRGRFHSLEEARRAQQEWHREQRGHQPHSKIKLPDGSTTEPIWDHH